MKKQLVSAFKTVGPSLYLVQAGAKHTISGCELLLNSDHFEDLKALPFSIRKQNDREYINAFTVKFD